MSEDVDKLIERALEEMREREQIRCPFCKEILRNDDCMYPVSYWGSESGPEEIDCEDCEKSFFVEEIVRREYKVAKTKEEIDDM